MVSPAASRRSPSGTSASGQPLADQRPDRPGRGEPGQLGVAFGDRAGVPLLVQAPVQADDRVVLHERVVQRGRRDVAAGEADDQDPAFERDALGGLAERVAAHRVVHDVRAASAGDVLDDRDEVLTVPVHDHVRAEFPRRRRLLRAAGHADDPCPGGLAQLDGAAADAARRRVHEQRLAGGQPRPAVQPEPPGLVGDEERRRLGVVEPRGRGHRARRVHEGVLGERPVRQHGPADDPVSGGEARHVRSGRHDLPAQLDAGAERQRRADLVGAKAQQRVGEVRRGREHPHQELPGTR